MASNITALQTINSSNMLENFTGALLINSDGLFFVLGILIFMMIIIFRQVRNDYTLIEASFIAVTLAWLPVLLLRSLEFANIPYLPDEYIALHIALTGITGLFTYWSKR